MPDDAWATAKQLTWCVNDLSPLPQSLFGMSATELESRWSADDKPTRKAAKAVCKSVNATIHNLEGLFVLGAGPRGLTVHGLPPR